jgi:hypothetical protein
MLPDLNPGSMAARSILALSQPVNVMMTVPHGTVATRTGSYNGG